MAEQALLGLARIWGGKNDSRRYIVYIPSRKAGVIVSRSRRSEREFELRSSARHGDYLRIIRPRSFQWIYDPQSVPLERFNISIDEVIRAEGITDGTPG